MVYGWLSRTLRTTPDTASLLKNRWNSVMTDHRLPLYDMPGHLIRRCQQISVGLFHDEFGESGFTPIQFAVLCGVEGHPGIEQNQLSKLVGIDRTTVGNVVSRLEKRGIIARTPDEKDRRLRRLVLTEDGMAMLVAAMPQAEHVQARILEPLSPAEQKQFIALMKKLVLGNNEGSRAPLSRDV